MSVPTHVQDLATACVASVKATIGVELDFSHETLPLLDHYARDVEAATEEILQLVAPMTGAYFGEVVRRHLGSARWHAPPDEYPEWRLEMKHVFLCFNPIGTALEVISTADTDGWSSHLRTRKSDEVLVKHALKVFGDVREDDYYTFSIRFETIEQVFEGLTRQLKKGEEPFFGTQDYAREILKELN